MNKFEKWLFATMFIAIVLLVGVSVIYRFEILDPLYLEHTFTVPGDVNTLFVGASHAACAFDPDEIPGSANMGKSGEPVFFTYYKLKRILNDNPQVKNIVLAFSTMHVSGYQDDRLFGESSNTRNVFLDYFFLLSPGDYGYFKLSNEDYLVARAKFQLGMPLSYLRDIKLAYRFYRHTLRNTQYTFWGGTEGNKIETHLEAEITDKKVAIYYHDGNGLCGISPVAVEHMDKIVDLCARRGLTLTLVRTPIHPSFATQIPDYFSSEYQEIVSDIEKRHPEVRYLDFSRFKLDDQCYLDGDHLNVAGRKIFTEALKDDLVLRE